METGVKKIASYQDLLVWRESRKLATLIYKQVSAFPAHERYGLADQMRRAAVSVPSNIAEGFGRATAKEKNQFYYTAKGSLSELETQVFIACDVEYLTKDELRRLLDQTELTHRLLQGLIKANKERL